MLVSIIYDLILTFKRPLLLSITYNSTLYAHQFVSKYYHDYLLPIHYLLFAHVILLLVFCFYAPCITHSRCFDFIYYKIYLYCIFCSFKITAYCFICILCKFLSLPLHRCLSTKLSLLTLSVSVFS